MSTSSITTTVDTFEYLNTTRLLIPLRTSATYQCKSIPARGGTRCSPLHSTMEKNSDLVGLTTAEPIPVSRSPVSRCPCRSQPGVAVANTLTRQLHSRLSCKCQVNFFPPGALQGKMGGTRGVCWLLRLLQDFLTLSPSHQFLRL